MNLKIYLNKYLSFNISPFDPICHISTDPPQNIHISHHDQLPNIYSSFMGNFYKLQYSSHDLPIYKNTSYDNPWWKDSYFLDTSEGNAGNKKRTILHFNSLEIPSVSKQFRDKGRMWRVRVKPTSPKLSFFKLFISILITK